jgi:3-hydroxyanthranilate 3,4-dioxygenase
MGRFNPINFQKWINDNRHLLQPPVGNKLVFEDTDFIVMAVGGPNSRNDYHVNSGEEFFYQVEGDMVLKVIENDQFVDIPIKAGEMFLLPANTPHSPQRPANTVGLVIEKKRAADELDAFQWHCQSCGNKLYSETFHLTDIVKQFPPIFERFYADEKNTTCTKCGAKLEKPNAKN